jgi:O-antigen ligase
MALHDAPAFAFLAVITGTLTLRENALEEIRATVPWVIRFSVVPLALILAVVATGRVMVGPFEAWVGRYQGWAINANAVALVMAPVPFVIFFRLGRTRGWLARAGWVLLLLATILVGVATLSDGLTVAWTLGMGTLLVLSWLNLVSRPRLPLGKAALAYVAVPLLTVLAVLLAGYQAWHFLQESAEDIYNKQEGQGSFRLRLWQFALVAISRSPLVGLGPGAHSGHLGPFSDGEAHNTFLDWGASTGLLGVALYVALLAWVLTQAYRARTPTLLCAAISIAAFSMFHYVLRHPVFWFYLIYVAAESQARMAAPPEGEDERDVTVIRGGSPGGVVGGVPEGVLT